MALAHDSVSKGSVKFAKQIAHVYSAFRMTVKPSKPPTPRIMDVAELEQMVEPLTVQVSRMTHGQFSPIALPIGESGAAGVGWTKLEVQGIETWLLNDWAGGGMYEISVTDSSTPVPRTLKWRPFWETTKYPEKLPPTQASAARPTLIAQAQAAQIAQQPTPQVPSMQFPNGMPGGGMIIQPVPSPANAAAQPQYAAYQPFGFAGNFGSNADADRAKRLEDQLAQMQAQLRAAEAQAQQRTYQAELERQRSESAAMIQRLEQQIAALAQQLAQRAAQAPNSELEQLKAQMEAQRREQDAERREREMRDLIMQQQQQVQQQIAAMQQNFQALMTQLTQNQNKSDPMIAMMLEQQRNSIAAMERISGQSTAAVEKFQQFMMSPKDMMAIQKEASGGLDSITQKMANAFGGVVEMQQKVLESSLSLNQGGSPAIDLIREGVTSVKDLAARYVTATSKAKQVEAQSQAQTAQANAQATAIQAQAQAAIANAQARAALPPANVPPPTPRPTQPGFAGANGHKPNGSTFDEWQKQRAAEAKVPPAPPPRETVEPSRSQPQLVQQPPAQPGQRSDEELFGMALPEVIQTREGVAEFLKFLRDNPNSEAAPEEGSATPAAVAQGVMQASLVVQARKINVPALTEFLMVGRYDEFVAMFLPNAPQAYRDDLVVEIKKLTGEIEEPEPDEGDDDDDEGEESEDGSPSDDVADGSSRPTKKPARISASA